MSLFNIFKKKPPVLLSVRVNGSELCAIYEDELPCEKTPSVHVDANSTVSFVDRNGTVHDHKLGSAQGWAHISVRVHVSKACQADCVVGDSPTFDASALAHGKATGVRFQPFFLSGATVSNTELAGKGLFRRGLHFSGSVTPGNILLSCECDKCRRSFLIRSYHAGFSNSGYFYSGSGKYTLTVSTMVPGSPGLSRRRSPKLLLPSNNHSLWHPMGRATATPTLFAVPIAGSPISILKRTLGSARTSTTATTLRGLS
jgi:hypothetical protein